MSEPYLGEIRIFPYSFAPRNWAVCAGQLLPISQNAALFSILGTTYGGNGVQTYGLPDLRGRTAMHPGQGSGLTLRSLGETGGAETVTVTASQIPAHSHTLQGRTATATATGPSGQLLAEPSANARYTTLYAATGTQVAMDGSVIGNAGSSSAHNNMQPYLTLNACIALVGIFPSRN